MARKSSKSARKASAVQPAAASEDLETGAVLLPERCDTSSAASVAQAILARRGSAVDIDAAQVNRLGAQCVEVLLAAIKTWTAAGVPIAIRNPSAEFLDGVHLLGLSREALMIEGALT